jgi:hypothetical protein
VQARRKGIHRGHSVVEEPTYLHHAVAALLQPAVLGSPLFALCAWPGLPEL